MNPSTRIISPLDPSAAPSPGQVAGRVPEQAWGQSLGQRLFRTQAQDELPLTVSHERIYIVPSRRGWMFVLSLLVMLVGAINYNLSLGYALCFLLTGLFAAALIATYRNFSGIEVTRINQPEATLGEELLFELTLSNPGKVGRIGIDLGNSAGSSRIDLPAGKSARVNVAVASRQRGWQPAGRFALSSDYPLGLWFTWSYVHIDCHGLVYPAPEPSPPALPYSSDAAAGHSRSATQGDFESLRAYQPGDTPGSIAWKTLARGMGMHTRQFAADNPGHRLTLSWDATRGLSGTEEKLSRLAAWAIQASQLGIAFDLQLPSQTELRGSGEQHLRRVLRSLAVYGFSDADPGH